MIGLPLLDQVLDKQRNVKIHVPRRVIAGAFRFAVPRARVHVVLILITCAAAPALFPSCDGRLRLFRPYKSNAWPRTTDEQALFELSVEIPHHPADV